MTQTAEILKTPTSAAPESIKKCAELAQLVERFVDTKGEYDERIPGLHMSSLKAPISTPNCFYVLSVGMILKGSKRLLIGGKTYDYEAGSMLVTSIDLPTSYEIGAVSKDNPFVSLSLKLSPAILAELLAEDVSTLKPGEPYGFDAAPEELIEDFERLLRLLDRPAQIAARAPLLIRDIHYLALTSAAGNSLRSLYAPAPPVIASGRPSNGCGKIFVKPSRSSSSPALPTCRRRPFTDSSRNSPPSRRFSIKNGFGSMRLSNF